MSEREERFLLMKRGMYWRPNACGYTYQKSAAGRYSKEEAESRCRPGEDGVTMIEESAADDLSPSATMEARAKYWESRCRRAEVLVTPERT